MSDKQQCSTCRFYFRAPPNWPGSEALCAHPAILSYSHEGAEVLKADPVRYMRQQYSPCGPKGKLWECESVDPEPDSHLTEQDCPEIPLSWRLLSGWADKGNPA